MKFLFISLLVLIIILDKSENLVTAETDSTSDLEGEKFVLSFYFGHHSLKLT